MKLGRERKRGMNGEGRGQKESFFFSSPPPSFIIFYFRSNFCAITRSEKLATQATREESELDLIRMDWSDCAVPYICQWFNVCFPLFSSMWMNERELSKGKDEFFYKNEILTKWCVDRNFKVHECHRDRVFFFFKQENSGTYYWGKSCT